MAGNPDPLDNVQATARNGADRPRGRVLATAAAVGIALGAVALRIWSVSVLSFDLRIRDPILDARHYMELAAQLSRGDGWPQAPHFFGPLYPSFLSMLFRFAPAEPLSAQIAQSVLGLATLLLLILSVRRTMGTAAAWAAAILYVFYGPILAMESQVLMESLLLFLATATLWLWPSPGRGAWVHLLFGIACGLLAAGRASFLLLPAAALLLLLRPGRRPPGDLKSELRPSRRLILAALVAIGVLIPLLPQIVHQTRTTGHLQVLTLNGGMNLYVGNNPAARGIFSAPPGLDLNDDLTGTRSASVCAGQRLTLEGSSRYWAGRAIEFVRHAPDRALGLLGRKALLFLAPSEIPQVYDFQILSGIAAPLRVAFLRFGWILPLAILGLLKRGPGLRQLAPWLLLTAVAWIQTILFFATGRYRVAVIAGFLGLAALGALSLVEMIRRRRIFVPILVLGGITLLQILPPAYPVEKARSFDAYQLAVRHAREDRHAEALASYRKALRYWAASGEAWHGVGTALYRMGQLEEAVEAYCKAIERMPLSAVTHYALGVAYHRMGQDEAALTELQTATRINSLNPRFHHDLGIVLARLGRTDEAIEQWRTVLRLQPGHPGAIRDLRKLGVRP